MPREPATTGDARLSRLAATARDRRKALGLTQTDLANLAGTSLRFVHTLENAKGTVRLDKVLDVLAVLGLELRVTMTSGGDPPAGDEGKGPT